MLDRAKLDALLKSKWEGMKQALINEGIEAGLTYFNDESKPLYNDIFAAIKARLPQLVQEMQDIELIYLKNNAAKYRIRRNETYGGQVLTITYYIYFSIDENGIWRIERF